MHGKLNFGIVDTLFYQFVFFFVLESGEGASLWSKPRRVFHVCWTRKHKDEVVADLVAVELVELLLILFDNFLHGEVHLEENLVVVLQHVTHSVYHGLHLALDDVFNQLYLLYIFVATNILVQLGRWAFW